MTPRTVALRLLYEWDDKKNVHMEDLVHEQLRKVSWETRDRGFLTTLCYGAIRHRNTLLNISEHFSYKPLRRYPRTVRNAFALGIYQRLYLDTPAHAVVNSTVHAWDELAGAREKEEDRKRFVGFLNASLRGACDKIESAVSKDLHDRAMIDAPDTIWGDGAWARVKGLELPSRASNFPELLAIKFSHPPDMLRHWISRYEERALLEMLRWNNRPPTPCIVLKSNVNPEHYLRKLKLSGIEPQATMDPRTLLLPHSGEIERLPGFDHGEFWVQDLTARRVAWLLPRVEHATLLDLCAAPGGKLATLLDRGGYTHTLACDVDARRLDRIRANLERLGLDTPQVHLQEVPADPTRLRLDSFDHVIVDVPCSNTGVLARRHEARWRLIPEKMRAHSQLQTQLLRAAVGHVKRGGYLLYSTCSIEPAVSSTAQGRLRSKAA
ncbi:MAG: transcription antitermination factor NusB [Planctomycetota bacterium]